MAKESIEENVLVRDFIKRLSDNFTKESTCKHYCQNKESNKTCGRVDILCNNLKNCSKEYQGIYSSKKSGYFSCIIKKDIEDLDIKTAGN